MAVKESSFFKNNTRCAMLIGANNTGKSTLIRKIIKVYRLRNPKNKVICFDPQECISHLSDSRIFTLEDLYKNLPAQRNSVKDSLVIVDDFRMLFEQNNTPQELLNALQLRTKRNVEVVFACHSPDLVLTRLAYFITDYYLFYTQTAKKFDEKIPSHIYAQTGINIINSYVIKNGSGKYPDFPHIVFDTKKNLLIKQNMK